MDSKKAKQIASNPAYQELVQTRSQLSKNLTVATLVMYFSFILFIAFAPEILATPMGNSVISWGIMVGVGIIVLSIMLTGYYVYRANHSYDELLRQIHKDNHAS